MSNSPARAANGELWNKVAAEWGENHPYHLWRRHSDHVYLQLLERWLDEPPVDTLLKTDLFDEAVAEGVFPLLATKARRVVGVDLSSDIAAMAASRYCQLETVQADTRRLPFADESFDTVVSLSSLDHFGSVDGLVTSLRELNRVLRPGGEMLLTMDNLSNPVVWLRSVLPFRLLKRLGLVPYYVGRTCRLSELISHVESADFAVGDTTAIMHCPRVLAVAVTKLLRNRSQTSQNRFLEILSAFERLQTWRTLYATGYYIALHAQKR